MRIVTASGLAFAALGLVIGFAPSPVRADEKADLATVRACLGEKADDPRSCIGVVSEPCMNEPDGSTTMGMNECAGREEAAWDILLNERYAAQVERAKAMDVELKQSPATENGTSVLESLKTAQRAWISYRDAECERRWAEFQGGTIASNIASGCLLDMTANRAVDLGFDEN